MALPDSYAGVIAAIKEQSGSTKFYKPNFQGIIEAIKDMGGGGSIEVLPPGSGEPAPGNDGDMIAIPNGDDNYFLYVYADGAWQKIHVTTEEVETIGSAPFIEVDGINFENQSQINQYIWDHLKEIEAKGYDDTLIWADQQRQDDELNQHKEYVDKGQAAQDDRIDALDLWIKGDQSRQDDEFIKGQAAQDKALAEYKQEVANDQARQDAAIDELQGVLKPTCFSKDYLVVESVDHYPTVPSSFDEIGINVFDEMDAPRLIISEKPPENGGNFLNGEYTFGDAVVALRWVQPHTTKGWDVYHYDIIEGTLPAFGTTAELSYNECPDLIDIEDYVTHYELKEDQERQDEETLKRDALLEAEILLLSKSFADEQAAQDDAFAKGQAAQNDAFAADQARQDAALQDEIDARAERDLQHDAEIDTIEYKLEALLGLQFRGTYRFEHDIDCDAALMECYQNAAGDINAQTQCNKDMVACEQGKVIPGTFEAVDPDDQFENLLSITVHHSDISMIETDWGAVLDAGDYLEIDHYFNGEADKTNYGLYRILAEPESATNAAGEQVHSFELEFLQGDGQLNEGELYEIRGINKDEGVNPEELADFLTREDAAKTYLPLIGGTLTGTLKMSDNNKIHTRFLDSGQNSDLQIGRKGERRILVGDDKVVFDKPAHFGGPINEDQQLATKKYVDDNKASGPKGEKGAEGEGEKGDKGRRGATGTGSQGPKGNRGSTGSTGATGSVKMKTGTSTSPSLSRGEMYWNYNNYTIYVGK